jgi:3'-phosphoadenosine 5'-phosphosulfate sulfotransferase (PAPS reductase)/FAD synthetase
MTGIDLDALDQAVDAQLELFGPDVPHVNLWDYDLIIINSSAGKDSLATIIEVYRLAIEQDYPLDRIVVQYNSLGDRVSWPGTADIGPNAAALVAAFGDRPGTRQLAEQQATRLGLRLVVSSRSHATDVDLLDHIERKGKFPDNGRRFCTAEHKRGPGKTVITAEYKALGDLGRRPRLLYVFGFRAAESSARAKKIPFVADAHTNTMRAVDEWYPVHHWSTEQVWTAIRGSGLPWHWAYDAGMTRLSCSFCVLAGGADLILAAALRPDVAIEYARVEAVNLARGLACGDMQGRQFQENRSMADIIAAARNHPIIARLGLDTELFNAHLLSRT